MVLQSQELVLLELFEQEPAQLEVDMERQLLQPVVDDRDARSDRHDRDVRSDRHVDEVRVIRSNTLPIR